MNVSFVSIQMYYTLLVLGGASNTLTLLLTPSWAIAIVPWIDLGPPWARRISENVGKLLLGDMPITICVEDAERGPTLVEQALGHQQDNSTGPRKGW